jgi:hypothetical protein
VIASSKGYAFIRPARDVFREIKDTLDSNVVQLPTPFDLLANLSTLGGKQLVPIQAHDFAKQSIATDSLRRSSQSPSAEIIQGVLHKHLIHEAVLCRILQATGSDVVGALRKSEIWDSARSGNFGEKEKSVQVLKTLSQEAKLPTIDPDVLKSEGNDASRLSDEICRFLPKQCAVWAQKIDLTPITVITAMRQPMPSLSPTKVAPAGGNNQVTAGRQYPYPISSLSPTKPAPAGGNDQLAEGRQSPYPSRTRAESLSGDAIIDIDSSTGNSITLNRSLRPPFSYGVLPRYFEEPASKEWFPTIAGTGDTVFFAVDHMDSWLRDDMNLHRLNRIQSYLWLAGRPMRARPLHRYRLYGLEIRYTQQVDLHLLRTRKHLMLKPLPRWILSHEFWQTHIVHDSLLHESATGFLMSYVWLLTTPIDFKIAQDLALIDISLTWGAWSAFVKDFLTHVDINKTKASINKRYIYGELQLDWINMIYRCRFPSTHLRRAYFSPPASSIASLVRFQVWVLIGFVFFNLVLSAMQVGSSVPGLEGNYTFQRASYGFVVYSMVVLATLAGLIGIGIVVSFLSRMVTAFRLGTSRTRAWQQRMEKEE